MGIGVTDSRAVTIFKIVGGRCQIVLQSQCASEGTGRRPGPGTRPSDCGRSGMGAGGWCAASGNTSLPFGPATTRALTVCAGEPCLSGLAVFPTAFEDMLENPLNSTQWMNDPETGPVMLQISRIFQTLNRT